MAGTSVSADTSFQSQKRKRGEAGRGEAGRGKARLGLAWHGEVTGAAQVAPLKENMEVLSNGTKK